MVKKLLFIIVSVAVLSIGGFVYLESQQKSVVSQTLSVRSKEYLKEKQAEIGSEWQYQSLDGESKEADTRGVRQYVGECFSFTTPFKIFNTRIDEEKCSGYFAFQEHNGKLNIYSGSTPASDFEDIPGVPERRKQPELYKESSHVVNGKEYLFFRNKQESGYETLAVTVLDSGYFVASLRAGTSENLDKQLEEIVGTVEFGQ